MKLFPFSNPYRTLSATGLTAILFCASGHGAISVLDYYRLGEADAGAANGTTVNATSQDSVGTKHLTRFGSPTYTNGVASEASLHAGSALAVNFNGSGQGLSNGIVSAVTDNFGIEAWARPFTASGNQSIAYNGNTGSSGWGIYQLGANYGVLFGGATSFTSSPVTVNSWTHLALVRASGTTTFYVNGVAAGTSASAPFVPAGGFGVGMPGQGGATENFNGQIDEVRVFTFTAGQFSTNDLLWNAPLAVSMARMTAALQTDVNSNGLVNPGDSLRYTVVLSNNTAGTLSNVVYNSGAVSNAPGIGGSLRASPLARADAPPPNSTPGNSFHGTFNTTLSVPAASGFLTNDFLGLPSAPIVSFGGGAFGALVTANAAGTTANNPAVGALTVNGDGSLTFAPATGFVGTTTFQYRLANSLGTNDTTATLAIGKRPTATNDNFSVTGNTMVDSSLIPTTLLANDGGDGLGVASNTAPAHGTASVTAAGNFIYTPALAYTGADSFTYVLTNGLGSSTGTVTLTVSNKLWYIDNSVAANGDGRSSSPFKQTSDFTTANDAAAGHPADNDLIFLRQGSSNYTGSTSLRLGQKIFGDGTPGPFSSVFGFLLAPGSAKAAGVAVPALTGIRPFISVPTATGVSLNGDNTVRGLNVHSANGRAFSGASVGLLVISNLTASAAGDRVLNLNSGNVNVTLDGASSTNSVDTGITLAALSGTVTINGGFITGAASTDFQVSGGSATINFAGNINNTAGRSVDINGMTGGGVTLSGNITDTGTGVSIQNNTAGMMQFTGASKQFNTGVNTALTLHSNVASIFFTGGGLDVDTTSGTAVSIMGGGTVIVNGAGNTINATTGTAFLNSGLGGSAFIDINAAIANTSGRLLDIQNRAQAMSVSLSGNLTNSGAGILIQNNTAGSMTFSGLAKVINTGVAGAVSLANNTGATISFSNGGLDVDTTGGTGFSVTGGGVVLVTGSGNTVTTGSGTAFLNSGTGGSATVSLALDLTSTAGRVVDIQNRTTGNVELLGTLSNSGGTGMLVQNNSGGTNLLGGLTKTFSTGANTAVNLVNNTGTTITFLNPLTITTTTGIGFNATGGGTVTVQNASTGNSVSTTIGVGVNIANTTIGASGVAFRSVSVNGASSGIVLDNTGASGSFSVVGSGITSQGGDNSGGTITSTTGHGISLNNTLSPSFANMNIQSTGGSGINGTNVNNFTFAAGKILNAGNALGESSISFNGNGTLTGNNIAGVLTVVNSVLTNAFDCGIHVENTAGTITDLVVTNNSINSQSSTNTSKGDGIRLVGTGTPTTAGSLMKARIRNNTVRNFPTGAGIQVSYGNTNATGPLGTCGIPNDSANLVEISGNVCRGASPAIPFAKNAIAFGVSGGNSSQRSRGNFNVANNGTVGNPIGDCFNIALQVVCLGYATMTATIDNNVIVANNALGSGGIAGGSSFLFSNPETPDLTLTVINNNVSQVDGNGILLFARGTTSTTKLGIRNNTVAAPLGGARPGIRVDAGNASSADDYICLDISGNVTAGTGHTIAGIGLRKQGTSTMTHDFAIEGMAATATPGVEQYVGNGAGGKNPGSENGVGDGSVNGVLLISATSGFSNCATAP